jgi:hypothetical protein
MNADLIFGLREGPFRYFALGSSDQAPSLNDIQLISETFRKAWDSIVRDTLVVTCTVNLGLLEANGTLAEIGNFTSNAPIGGVMYNRATFVPLTKTNTQTLLIICKFLC